MDKEPLTKIQETRRAYYLGHRDELLAKKRAKIQLARILKEAALENANEELVESAIPVVDAVFEAKPKQKRARKVKVATTTE
jgi:hypothetical protein